MEFPTAWQMECISCRYFTHIVQVDIYEMSSIGHIENQQYKIGMSTKGNENHCQVESDFYETIVHFLLPVEQCMLTWSPKRRLCTLVHFVDIPHAFLPCAVIKYSFDKMKTR